MMCNRFRSACAVVVSLILLTLAGCSYFNTYYNIDKDFKDAEHDYERSQAPASPAPQGTPPRQGGSPARPQQQNVPTDKYRKVIETGAKLLEYYPKSRWVDDTLLLMGISYFRLQDYSRAERKFTELITLYPKSRHVPDAVIWKARSLLELKQHDAATKLLNDQASAIKNRGRRGQVEYLLATIEDDQKDYEAAADHFKQASDLLPAGEEKFEALYKYAQSAFELKQYHEADDAFSRVARSTRNRQMAFDAHVFSSRAALASGDPDRAELILKRLKENSAFEPYSGDIDLELANLAVESGRIDEGIEFYQKYLDEHPTGEKRGLAFFRLADVFSKHRVELPRARALLDSAIRTGSNRELMDSARAVQEEITHGLQVLTQYQAESDSLRSLEARRNALLQGTQGVHTPERMDTSSARIANSVDTTKTITTSDSSLSDSQQQLPRRLGTPEVPQDTSSQEGAVSPGIVDSLSSSAVTDSVGIDSARTHEITPEQQIDQVETRLADARARKQLAALRVAEFYEFIIQDRDSALTYYRIAASEPFNRDVYWRANLFLADEAEEDSSRRSDADQYYRAVVEADSVPVDAANRARRALGMQLLERKESAQERDFRMAEEANLSDSLPADSVVKLYGAAVVLDSSSLLGMKSLFSQMYIYEQELHMPDSAKTVAERLIALFPDSSFAGHLRTIILPPDTAASIFALSDEQLAKAWEPKESVIEETPKEGGWPPPEDELRGRRYD